MLQQEGYATRRRSDAEAAERDPNQRLQAGCSPSWTNVPPEAAEGSTPGGLDVHSGSGSLPSHAQLDERT